MCKIKLVNKTWSLIGYFLSVTKLFTFQKFFWILIQSSFEEVQKVLLNVNQKVDGSTPSRDFVCFFRKLISESLKKVLLAQIKVNISWFQVCFFLRFNEKPKKVYEIAWFVCWFSWNNFTYFP